MFGTKGIIDFSSGTPASVNYLSLAISLEVSNKVLYLLPRSGLDRLFSRRILSAHFALCHCPQWLVLRSKKGANPQLCHVPTCFAAWLDASDVSMCDGSKKVPFLRETTLYLLLTQFFLTHDVSVICGSIHDVFAVRRSSKNQSFLRLIPISRKTDWRRIFIGISTIIFYTNPSPHFPDSALSTHHTRIPSKLFTSFSSASTAVCTLGNTYRSLLVTTFIFWHQFKITAHQPWDPRQ
jgi:hypothetical protein